jgi:hypothetical protein
MTKSDLSMDSLNDTRARGLENVLHLHGLQDSKRCAFLHLNTGQNRTILKTNKPHHRAGQTQTQAFQPWAKRHCWRPLEWGHSTNDGSAPPAWVS